MTSAQQLVGLTLDGGWKVVSAVVPGPLSTGGNFSEGYIVEFASGKRAFLKALDFSRAFQAPDPTRAIQSLTESFNFERDVLRRCSDRRLDRVVVALADGVVRLPNATDGGVVPYLIFELADGDVRSQVDLSKRFDLAWALRSLHHVATGLWQLHRHGIAHQDLKPSNILVYGGAESRIADLGRASYQGHFPPHEGLTIAGDPTYAPPELLYRQVDPNWHNRRCGCDVYLLGSMLCFFFTGAAITPLLRAELPSTHVWFNWSGTYSEALPYLSSAFSRVLQSFKLQVDPRVRDTLTTVLGELCEPDPTLRGHPKNRGRPLIQYSLERYVTTFDLLARRAEARLWK